MKNNDRSTTRGVYTLLKLILTIAIPASSAVARGGPQESADQAILPDSTGLRSSETKFGVTELPKRNDWLSRDDWALVNTSKRLVSDQRNIWTRPLRLKWVDSEWLVPIAGITTGMILTDANFSRGLSNNPTTLSQYNEIRNGSVAALGFASAGLILWSFHSHDPHQRETGWLASAAILDSLALTQGVKFVAGRERPDQGNGDGNFFVGGTSFPSAHSAAAWAAAGVLAHEYPGPMTKLLAYGLATTVSIASVGSKQHFPSDVLIGSGIGWLVSEYVYRAHHNPELGGSAWSPMLSMIHSEQRGVAEYPGSTYVPLGSWVYSAFDRLAALGYLNSAFQGTRPWSREQCVHLLQDAEESLGESAGRNAGLDPQTFALLLALHREFAREEVNLAGANKSAEVDSIYMRVLNASGKVLNDGYHFGQTIAYDFGRPFREGTNLIDGATASATYGSLFFYLGGEYQHAPSAPSLSPAEIQFIADRDRVAPVTATPFASMNQFQLLDAYAGINLHGWQISFGNQSLSWGPGIGGSLLLSNNAAPFPMLQMSSASPLEIPGLSKLLGPFHLEQFYGRVSGFTGSRQPWIYGQKISFKPIHSIEFAYGRTTFIGGPNHPLTTNLFFESLIGRVNAAENSVPGDSRTSLEWTWRLPKLRNWVTFYGELEDDDDLIPLQNVAKSIWRPGLYVPHLPLLPKWDMHFEWTSSTSPGRAAFQAHGDLNYWNFDYTSGYTNNGNLMGNTVGREGVTLQAWTRYWIAPRQTLDFSWKQSRVLADYIPGGGRWQDYQANYSYTLGRGFYLNGILQIEHISSFPLLFAGSRDNVTAAIEVGFLPQWAHKAASPTSSQRADAAKSIGDSLR